MMMSKRVGSKFPAGEDEKPDGGLEGHNHQSDPKKSRQIKYEQYRSMELQLVECFRCLLGPGHNLIRYRTSFYAVVRHPCTFCENRLARLRCILTCAQLALGY